MTFHIDKSPNIQVIKTGHVNIKKKQKIAHSFLAQTLVPVSLHPSERIPEISCLSLFMLTLNKALDNTLLLI